MAAMRKDLFIHFCFWFAFFVLISIIGGNLSSEYWPFWLGGVIGTILPDVDHLIYILFLNPQELTSQRFNYLLRKKAIGRAGTLLTETKNERKEMVFHSFFFQIIFFLLTLFVVSSTSSIFVYGIVLAFSLHFLADQVIDMVELKTLENWGKLFSSDLDKHQSIIYISVLFLLLFLMGVLI